MAVRGGKNVKRALAKMCLLITTGRYHQSGNPYTTFPELREAFHALGLDSYGDPRSKLYLIAGVSEQTGEDG